MAIWTPSRRALYGQHWDSTARSTGVGGAYTQLGGGPETQHFPASPLVTKFHRHWASRQDFALRHRFTTFREVALRAGGLSTKRVRTTTSGRTATMTAIF